MIRTIKTQLGWIDLFTVISIKYIYQTRKRTKPDDIGYSLHIYFLDLSLRNTSKAISFCIKIVQRSHTAIRDWIQKYKPERLFYKREKVSEFILVCKKMELKSKLSLSILGYGLLSIHNKEF